MKKIALLVILIVSLTAISCKVKNACELNHSGSIAVINKTGSTVELRINNEKIGELPDQMVKTVDGKIVGSYDINAICYPKVWDTTVNVVECELVEYTLR
ncbi:MAG: hypothetical protein J6T63_03920 [Bacteroidales bacterium]|nr:hypothetical protein [Bacteroidales bacterium]